ncbi:MAG: outer membrane protein assembly factor BamD, partial [Deltaproteobacteria bacterium]|nr:outer membrane protein assembly factor BamD [Deltaproteobacteria bacterium]
MSLHLDPRRESARSFFERLESALGQDETLRDKRCIQLILEKARTDQAPGSQRRFDIEATFRNKLLYGCMDDFIHQWCRRHDVRTDPFNVFRYEGKERGPTQHETAVGLARPAIERALSRLAEQVPELTDCRVQVFSQPTKAITPAFRLQHPLPFGAVGDVRFGGTRSDLDRLIYRTAMYAATGGDVSRGWRYDCGVLIFFSTEGPHILIERTPAQNLARPAAKNLAGGTGLGNSAMRTAVKRLIATIVALIGLAGCAEKPKLSADEYFQRGNSYFRQEALSAAIDHYRELLDQYPFSEYNEEAEIKIAHAQFLAGNYAEAVVSLTDFQRRHPTSPHLPFVGYYLGMCYVRQAGTIDRDQTASQNAQTYFLTVSRQYPDSPFAELAREQLARCREDLGQHELYVAEFYDGRGNSRAAEIRLLNLATQYGDTDAAAEGLMRL